MPPMPSNPPPAADSPDTPPDWPLVRALFDQLADLAARLEYLNLMVRLERRKA